MVSMEAVGCSGMVLKEVWDCCVMVLLEVELQSSEVKLGVAIG